MHWTKLDNAVKFYVSFIDKEWVITEVYPISFAAYDCSNAFRTHKEAQQFVKRLVLGYAPTHWRGAV